MKKTWENFLVGTGFLLLFGVGFAVLFMLPVLVSPWFLLLWFPILAVSLGEILSENKED